MTPLACDILIIVFFYTILQSFFLPKPGISCRRDASGTFPLFAAKGKDFNFQFPGSKKIPPAGGKHISKGRGDYGERSSRRLLTRAVLI